jgi:hypothetical protein
VAKCGNTAFLIFVKEAYELSKRLELAPDVSIVDDL